MSDLKNRYRYSKKVQWTTDRRNKRPRARRRPREIILSNGQRLTRAGLGSFLKERKEAKERKLRKAYKEVMKELKEQMNVFRRHADEREAGTPMAAGGYGYEHAGLSSSGGDGRIYV